MNSIDPQFWYRSRTAISGEMSDPAEENLNVCKVKNHSRVPENGSKTLITELKNSPMVTSVAKTSKKSVKFAIKNLEQADSKLKSSSSPPINDQMKKEDDLLNPNKTRMQNDSSQATLLNNSLAPNNKKLASKKLSENVEENKEKVSKGLKLSKPSEEKNQTQPKIEKPSKKTTKSVSLPPRVSESAESCTKNPVSEGSLPSPEAKAVSPNNSKSIFQCPNPLCTQRYSTCQDLLSHIKSKHALSCKIPYCTFSTYTFQKYINHFQLIHCADPSMPKKRRGRKPQSLSNPQKFAKN